MLSFNPMKTTVCLTIFRRNFCDHKDNNAQFLIIFKILVEQSNNYYNNSYNIVNIIIN